MQHEPVFAESWQARALALTLAAGALGQWNIDVSRHAREKLAPGDYARFSYYEKWLAAVADLLVDTGVISEAELTGTDPTPSPLASRALRAEAVQDVLATGGPATRESACPQVFQPGDRVRTRRITANRLVDGGHTRLPRYAAGASGRVLRCHGAHVLPDSAAHLLGEAPEPLYAVSFPASQLWANPEHPGDEVILDLWQSYLDPVT
jgi:nitrile hydratase